MRVSGSAAGFNLRTKYKGHHNRNTQIRSTFSQDGTFLICGSDDGWVYIWTTGSGADDEKLPKQVGVASSSRPILASAAVIAWTSPCRILSLCRLCKMRRRMWHILNGSQGSAQHEEALTPVLRQGWRHTAMH